MPKKLQPALHPTDPYSGFQIREDLQDLQGWGSDHPFFAKIFEAFRPSCVIEVGTWKGRSAIHMAKLARQLGLDTEIVCVDTFLGSPEHITNPDWYGSLKHVNGYPNLYYTFLNNVLINKCDDIITPFAIASESAAAVLRHLRAQAEIIYIDAAHERDPALRDMTVFWDILSEDGCMILDDYGYSDVTGAACSFAAKVDRPLYASYGKAIIPRNKARRFELTLDMVA